MRLDALLGVLGSDRVVADVVCSAGSAEVVDIVLLEPEHAVRDGDLVLAVGVDPDSAAACEAVVTAGRGGACAVVFRAGAGEGPARLAREQGVSLLRLQDGVGWTGVLALVRALVSSAGAHEQSPLSPAGAGSIDRLADAVAASVGGSVVVYDRVHRVVAFSVEGYDIDDVRRETILGHRTPGQWIERFTSDSSAYETMRRPDRVVRVDRYPELATRLRVAVRSAGQILGEISVAEDGEPFSAGAERALLSAARAAEPYLLRHRVAEDTDRASSSQAVGGLLRGDACAAVGLGLSDAPGFVVVAIAGDALPTDAGRDLTAERVLHLLALHLGSLDPRSCVAAARSAFYGVVPSSPAAAASLSSRISPALTMLGRIGVTAHAALSGWVDGVRAVPEGREVADDLIEVLRRPGWPRSPTVVTADERWPDLALLPAERALVGTRPVAALQRLLEHDDARGTDHLGTLRTFLDSFGSVSETAARMSLHTNSVRHRMDRLVLLSGLDLDDPVQRLAVMVQLRSLDLGRRG